MFKFSNNALVKTFLFITFLNACSSKIPPTIRTEEYLKVQTFEIPESAPAGTIAKNENPNEKTADQNVRKPQEFPVDVGDILTLAVYGRADLSGELLVRGDGSIFVPLAGDVEVAKKTPREIQAIITQKLQKYFKEVNVGVYVKESRSALYSVLGAVNGPGRFPWNRPMSVYEAIAQAGGFSTASVGSHAFILRNHEKIPVNLEHLLSPSKAVEKVDVIPGDIVVVPSHNEFFIAVLGRVASPGLVPIRGTEMKLAQALALAGGPKRGAKLDQVRILRAAGKRKYQLLTVNMEKMLDKGIPPMLPGLDMIPGDVLYVPQTGISNFSEALVEIAPILQVLSVPLGITSDILLIKEFL